MAHFEIIRTDAEQPWHARLIVNGHKTWVTENLTRKVGAERAILSAARTFGWNDPHLIANTPTEKILVDGRNDAWLAVLYLDERGAR